MSEVIDLIKAFARGELGFDALSDSFDRVVAENPDQIPRIRKILEKARAAGLPAHVCAALGGQLDIARKRIEEVRRNPSHSDTVVLPASSPVTERETTETPLAQTVVLPAGAGGKPRGPAAGKAAGTPEPTPAAPEPVPHGAPDTPVSDPAREDPDTTVFNPEAEAEPTDVGTPDDATRVHSDEATDPDATQVGSDPGKPTGPSAAPTAPTPASTAREQSGTDSSWPTDTGLSGGPEPGTDGEVEFSEGSMLRGRFRLLSALGEGGMGVVWKAIDLLKEEARDRNPFVAIKLLQGDFKEHPEAFIALQRETAKQQRLAHPNIATVFDFDRDVETGTVYMTMEVLEGSDLAAFIRKLPADGLPEEEAMPLIEQLAAGLSYAHHHKLVHSDLKPGNCFITKDNTIKLLDFGIARASKTKGDAEGETTLFDPGQLGALTPTYATIEMFEGMEPDPRDDIYALSIISYQLLTGKHPYGKKSAPKARDLGLVPDSVDKLTKRQNRGLQRAAALMRDDRTATVDEFLHDIQRQQSRWKQWTAAAVVALFLVGAAAYNPTVTWFAEREKEQIIAAMQPADMDSIRTGLGRIRELADPARQLAVLADRRVRDLVVGVLTRGDEESVGTGLAMIEPLPASWRKDIMEDERTQNAIIDLYTAKKDAAVNPAQGRFAYPEAEKHVEAMSSLYPDSARIFRIKDELQRQKDTELDRLETRYNAFLEQGRVLAVDGEEDISDVLGVVAQIDPGHPLLTDRRLALRFADLVGEAMAKNSPDGYRRASEFLEAGLGYAPDDPSLGNLKFQVETELERIADRALIAGLQQRLEAEAKSLRALADFQRVRDDMVRLAELDPDNPLLGSLRKTLEGVFGAALAEDIAARRWDEAESRLVRFARLLDIEYLTGSRARLSAAEGQAGFVASLTPARRAAVEERTAAVSTLLESDRPLTGEWEASLRASLKELIALLPAEDSALAPLRERTARLYLARATAAREAGRFAESVALLDRGRTFYPGFPPFEVEREAIAAAAEALRRQQAEERRLARIEGLKRTLVSRAKSNQPEEAKGILAELARELPADDPFLAGAAPRAIGQAYERLATRVAEAKKWDAAVKLAEAGLALAPDNEALKKALAGYRAEYEKEIEIVNLRRVFSGTAPLDPGDLAARLAKVESQFPDRFPELRKEYGDLAVKRARARDPATPAALRSAAAELAAVKSLFPDRHAAAAQGVAGNVVKRVQTLEKEDAFKARDLLAAAREALPGHAELEKLTVAVPSKLAEDGKKEVAAGNLTAAAKILEEVQRTEPGAPNLPGFRAALERKRSQAESDFENYRRYAQAKRAKEGRPYLLRARAAWKDNPDPAWDVPRARKKLARGECGAGLAGLGSGRGTCYDRVAGEKGPVLVVVPAGGEIAKPFAIGKYEVTVSEFNLYCKTTEQCGRIKGSGKNPVTGISFAQAEAYAKWLSEQSKAVYRVPTSTEWEYAARAQGQQPKKNFNCTVQLQGKVVKGGQLMSASAGVANGWGLKNYVGNAQEWVKVGNGVSVRGGAHRLPLSECEISLDKPHSGGPDPVTGFRLLRELG